MMALVVACMLVSFLLGWAFKSFMVEVANQKLIDAILKQQEAERRFIRNQTIAAEATSKLFDDETL